MAFRQRYAAYGVVVLVLAGAATAGVIRFGGRGAGPAAPAATGDPLQTAEVVRTDISSGRPLPGTIGYGPARPLKAPGDGVLTWLPAAGATIKRGDQVYRVDDRPVPLFYGRVPLYRALDRPALVGRDVRVVADNLRALGYRVGAQPKAGAVITPGSPAAPTGSAPEGPAAPAGLAAPEGPAAADRPAVPTDRSSSSGKSAPAAPARTVHEGEAVMTASLIAALKAWQRDRQLPETGRIGRGDVVVQSAAIRVASVAAQVGDATGGDLMTVTATTKVISVPAEVGEAGSVRPGDTVTVALPDGTGKPARVVSIGTAVTPDAADPDAPPKLVITLKPSGTAGLDAAEVQVDFPAERHEDVLAVPVGALLALSEGGYAVQLAGGGLVAVRTGIIAQGLAEVQGDGLAEGTRVVTTS